MNRIRLRLPGRGVRQLRAHGLGGHLEPDPGQPGFLELGDQARASLCVIRGILNAESGRS